MCLLLVAGALMPASAIDVATVVQIQNIIEARINATSITNSDGLVKYPLIAAFVRLVFHDCNSPGGCDGCLNLGIPENNGLANATNNLESLYTNQSLGISSQMSRTDFWALAGLTAAYYGARLQRVGPRGTPIYLPPALVPANVFKTGRKDCPTAPVGSEASSNFPSGLAGQDATFGFFKDFYNFTTAETVAIMGAHTLGKAVVKDSGFQGPWVPGDNILSNTYYTTLSNATAGWAQAKAPGTGGLVQWQRVVPVSPFNTVIMLNADMCLYKQLTLNATGGSSCNYTTCPYNSGSAQTVQTYAANNTRWLNDFAAVFNKMLNVCGRPSKGVVTPCTLTAPAGQTTVVRAAAAAARRRRRRQSIKGLPLVESATSPDATVTAATEPSADSAGTATP